MAVQRSHLYPVLPQRLDHRVHLTRNHHKIAGDGGFERRHPHEAVARAVGSGEGAGDGELAKLFEGFIHMLRIPYESDMWVDNITDNLLVKAYERYSIGFNEFTRCYFQ